MNTKPANSLTRLHVVWGLILMATNGAGAASLPRIPDPMYHLGISLNGNRVELHGPDPAVPGNVLPLHTYGETYDPPADVLNGQAYNDQFGWVLDGIISKPAGSAFYLRLVSKDAGLTTYEGGMRMNRANHSYAVILDQPGDVWTYPESMTHHWYAAVDPGLYAVTYEVYLGDEFTSIPLPTYASDRMTLTFAVVPEPPSAVMTVIAAAPLALRRRKRGAGSCP